MKTRVVFTLCGLLFSVFLQASPINKHIQEILQNNKEAYHSDELLYNTYKERGFSAIWTKTEQIDSLIKALKSSVFDGLVPNNYSLANITETYSQRKNNEEKAYFDILLTDNFILLLYHLNYGKLNPKTIDPNWQISVVKNSIEKYLQLAIEKDAMYSVAQIEQSKAYLQLKQQLTKYLTGHSGREYPKIIPGALLKPGNYDSLVPDLRKYFAIYSPNYTPIVDDTATVYDSMLVNEVIRFQQLHGLRTDGVIGAETCRQLGISIEDRIQQIVANMERLRWLPKQFGVYYLLINIADYRLQVVKNDTIQGVFKIIVGTPYLMTPVFMAQIQNIVFNPAWIVPKTIVLEDILSNALKDSLYIEKHGFTIYRNKIEVQAKDVVWNRDSVLNYTFIMKTGKDNPLGVVKFNFPNEYDVYIHDTPARNLFNKTDRTYSSGCIRVENPLELAKVLINEPLHYSKENLDKIVENGRFKNIILEVKPNVILIYQTAWVDADGNLNFRKDIYGRDLLVKNALGFKIPDHLF